MSCNQAKTYCRFRKFFAFTLNMDGTQVVCDERAIVKSLAGLVTVALDAGQVCQRQQTQCFARILPQFLAAVYKSQNLTM